MSGRLDYAPTMVLTRLREGWVLRVADGVTGNGRVWMDDPKHAFVKYVNPRTFRLLLKSGYIMRDEAGTKLAVSRWKLTDDGARALKP